MHHFVFFSITLSKRVPFRQVWQVGLDFLINLHQNGNSTYCPPGETQNVIINRLSTKLYGLIKILTTFQSTSLSIYTG